MKKENEKKNNGRQWKESGRVINIKKIEETNQKREDGMTHDVTAKGDVAKDVAACLAT